MTRWLATTSDGRAVTMEEYELGFFATEAEARNEAEFLGASLHREKMQGAIYVTPDGRFFRVSSRGWAPGFVLTGTREAK